MRAAYATTIVSILEHSELSFTPVKDNITELLDPESARKSDHVARVPILTGTTAQDGRVYGERQPSFPSLLFPRLFLASNDF